MDGAGFHVDIDALDEAGSGISRCVADQENSHLSRIIHDSATYGSPGVHDAMQTFCRRWSDGLDLLTDDARAMGDLLVQVAAAYRAVDAAAARTLKVDPGLQAEHE